MAEKTEIKALELVRRIRDEQAELLAGKSDDEIIEFFRQAGSAAREGVGLAAKGNTPHRRGDAQPTAAEHG